MQPSESAPPQPALALARLVIHAAEGGHDDFTRSDGALGRLHQWAKQVTRRHLPLATCLEIADLQGRPVSTATELLPATSMTLPAGTYHVTLRQGGQVRRYTVALERGATVNLRLQVDRRGPG